MTTCPDQPQYREDILKMSKFVELIGYSRKVRTRIQCVCGCFIQAISFENHTGTKKHYKRLKNKNKNKIKYGLK